jgi:hypothetical protein
VAAAGAAGGATAGDAAACDAAAGVGVAAISLRELRALLTVSDTSPFHVFDASLADFFHVLEVMSDAKKVLASLENFLIERFRGRAISLVGRPEQDMASAAADATDMTEEEEEDDDDEPHNASDDSAGGRFGRHARNSSGYDDIDTTATRASLLSRSLLRSELAPPIPAAAEMRGASPAPRAAAPRIADVHHICILAAPPPSTPAARRERGAALATPCAVHIALELVPPPAAEHAERGSDLGASSESRGLAGDSIVIEADGAMRASPPRTERIRVVAIELAARARRPAAGCSALGAEDDGGAALETAQVRSSFLLCALYSFVCSTLSFASYSFLCHLFLWRSAPSWRRWCRPCPTGSGPASSSRRSERARGTAQS